MIIWAIGLMVLAATAAMAGPVYGTPVSQNDWSDVRTFSSGGGLTSLSASQSVQGYNFPAGSGIGWEIWQNPDNTFTYAYWFFRPDTEEPFEMLQVSHFILELSQGCIAEVEGQLETYCVWDAQREGQQAADLEPRTNWNSSGPGNSNPGMPSSIYGVKFDNESSLYWFTSDRIPVWGNFYAKKGNDGLWNLGLEDAYRLSESKQLFIPRPDTGTPGGEIPEPGTSVLLGAGLASLGLLRRKAQA